MESAEDRSIGIHSSRDSGWPVDLLRAVWSEHQPLLVERIEVIERATSALEEDQLSEQLRAEAERAAHMLAGSLGIFGSQTASDVARDLELALARPAPQRARAVRGLLSRLPRIDREPPVLRVNG
jgi:HPt (histidine-containing phosphotransfer) domain-containing protein